MNWSPHATRLALSAAPRGSRWRKPIADTPRHLFVPRWWQRGAEGWSLQDGASDTRHWLDAAYSDTSMVTRVGPHHADDALPGDHPVGRPTSSATLPSLVVKMFRLAHLNDGDQLLDLGAGSGYGTALATRRLGAAQVTAVDVDPYLVEAARQRLTALDLHPTMKTADATKALDGTYDRIVATVALRPIPESVLGALRPGGRLVTTLAGTSLIITAEKEADGGATGRVEWDRAGFMVTRHDQDYPPGLDKTFAVAWESPGEEVTTGPYPVVDVDNAWDLASMLSVTAPDIEHDYREDGDQRTAVMVHPDGSWARATALGRERPTVHQSGPQRLWDTLDRIRSDWLAVGELPVRGARAFIEPNGTIILARGKWHTKVAA